jgi:hypothetical protein
MSAVKNIIFFMFMLVCLSFTNFSFAQGAEEAGAQIGRSLGGVTGSALGASAGTAMENQAATAALATAGQQIGSQVGEQVGRNLGKATDSKVNPAPTESNEGAIISNDSGLTGEFGNKDISIPTFGGE